MKRVESYWKGFLGGFVLGAVMGGVASMHAQAPLISSAPATQAASIAPKLDELEKSYLQILNLTQEKAESDCQSLPSVQRFNATAADVLAKIEARHPGFTVDRTKGVLVAKAAK